MFNIKEKIKSKIIVSIYIPSTEADKCLSNEVFELVNDNFALRTYQEIFDNIVLKLDGKRPNELWDR